MHSLKLLALLLLSFFLWVFLLSHRCYSPDLISVNYCPPSGADPRRALHGGFFFSFVDKCLFSCSIRDSYFRGPFLNKYMCALCVQCCSLLRQSPDRHVPAWLIPTFDLFAYPMPNTNSNCVRRCGLNPISFVIWILFVVCVVFFWFGTFLSFFRRSCRSVGSPCLFIYSFLLICNWKLKRKESPFPAWYLISVRIRRPVCVARDSWGLSLCRAFNILNWVGAVSFVRDKNNNDNPVKPGRRWQISCTVESLH